MGILAYCGQIKSRILVRPPRCYWTHIFSRFSAYKALRRSITVRRSLSLKRRSSSSSKLPEVEIEHEAETNSAWHVKGRENLSPL